MPRCEPVAAFPEASEAARMADIDRIGDLEIGQDIDFQRRSWVAQRVGWAAMALVLTAAALGLFGPGVFNAAVAGERGGALWLEYGRFWRSQSMATLRVHLVPAAGTAGGSRVWLSRDYLDAVSVQRVTPPPERVEARPDRLTYVFALAEPGRPTVVTFEVEPQRPGPLAAALGVEGGPAVGFTQFIHP